MLKILDLGLRDYETVWEQQQKLQRELIAGGENDYLICCSHYPVITLGRSANKNNILNSKQTPIFEIERGGDVTYHGKGQIILYPILNLNRYKKDVCWYLRFLEETIIQVLRELEIPSCRITGKTGVWVQDKKIASLGIRISRWCTMHGVALNILPDDGFKDIIPCGLEGVSITSVIQESKNPEKIDLNYCKELMIQKFRAISQL